MTRGKEGKKAKEKGKMKAFVVGTHGYHRYPIRKSNIW